MIDTITSFNGLLYFANASTLKPLLSALLAIALWPLLLLGISLHIK